MTAASKFAPDRVESVFTGLDVCQAAGLRLNPGAHRPVYDEDVWDLTGLTDAHRQIKRHELIWDFSRIARPAWRAVAKDIVVAVLAPRHESVLSLPRAFRSPVSPRTCFRFVYRWVAWFDWLEAHGVRSLGEITQDLCDAYLEESSWSQPMPGVSRRRLAPGGLIEVVRAVQVPSRYGLLLTADR